MLFVFVKEDKNDISTIYVMISQENDISYATLCIELSSCRISPKNIHRLSYNNNDNNNNNDNDNGFNFTEKK